jgi:putative tricarboxylic transport membrane protein
MSGQTKNFNKHRFADLLVLLILAGLVGIYCVDAVRASTSILNLILVLPVTVIILVLCLIQFVMSVPELRSESDKQEPISDILPVVGLFAAYVISLHWLGFDVGTSLFLAIFLWLHGERRWPWLFAYSIGFAFALSLFFSKMLPYPMPMLILDSAY